MHWLALRLGDLLEGGLVGSLEGGLVGSLDGGDLGVLGFGTGEVGLVVDGVVLVDFALQRVVVVGLHVGVGAVLVG